MSDPSAELYHSDSGTESDSSSSVQELGSVLDSALDTVVAARRRRAEDKRGLVEELAVVDVFRSKLEARLGRKEAEIGSLDNVELQLKRWKLRTLGESLTVREGRSLEVEARQLLESLGREEQVGREAELLEHAVARSAVRIHFHEPDELLTKLGAENDEICLRLSASSHGDSEVTFLASLLLRTVFTQIISTQNKKFLQRSILSPSPLKTIRRPCPPPLTYQHPSLPSPLTRPPPPPAALSFSAMARRCPTSPPSSVVRSLSRMTVAESSSRPRAFLQVQVEREEPFRVVVELRPDMAPGLVENFLLLCKGLPHGRGYKGSKIFASKRDHHVRGGDFENNDGSGGHSAYEERYMVAEQAPLPDTRGAVRMNGVERGVNGRCKVASQFMVWLEEDGYKHYQYTLVFGRVVEGLAKLQEVSQIPGVQNSEGVWKIKKSVIIVDCGQL